MKSRRIIWFGLSIVVGLVIGLVYGWFFRTAAPQDLSFEALRADYKADYVLMVAEIYKSEKDAALAKSRLMSIGDQNVDLLVQQALMTARSLGYAPQDIELISALSRALPGDDNAGK